MRMVLLSARMLQLTKHASLAASGLPETNEVAARTAASNRSFLGIERGSLVLVAVQGCGNVSGCS
jgi:hypothetical protein